MPPLCHCVFRESFTPSYQTSAVPYGTQKKRELRDALPSSEATDLYARTLS